MVMTYRSVDKKRFMGEWTDYVLSGLCEKLGFSKRALLMRFLREGILSDSEFREDIVRLSEEAREKGFEVPSVDL